MFARKNKAFARKPIANTYDWPYILIEIIQHI